MLGNVNKILVVLFTTKNAATEASKRSGKNRVVYLSKGVMTLSLFQNIISQEGPERDRNCRAIYNESYVDQ